MHGPVTLSKKTVFGAGWLIASRMGGRIIDFVTVLVLARMLVPADFGLTALAASLVATLDSVFEIPLIQALTRLRSVKKSHLDTAFTLGVLRALLFSFVILAAAYPFSVVFHDSRLTALVAVLALGPIVRSIYNPSMVKFIRLMSFRQAFMAELLGKILAFCVAVGLVFYGGGYWAIAASSITASLVTTLLSYVFAPFRPSFSLSKRSDFLSFLGWYSLSQVISVISWQFDKVLLGYFITKSDLGKYSMANDLSVLPTQSLIGPAMQPVMAALARITHDPDRLRIAYLKASRFTMMLAASSSIGISLTADLIVNLLLGHQWIDAVVYLRWLALGTTLYAYYPPIYSLSLAMNRNNTIFVLSLVEMILKIIFVTLGLYYFSVIGAIAGRGVVSIIMYFAYLLAVREMVGIGFIEQAANLWRVAASCCVMALLVIFVRNQLSDVKIDQILELCVISSFGAAVYFGALYVFGFRFRT